MELAAERTKTFWNRKLVRVSTPTLETGNIWQAWLRADAQYKYFVPCPFCGAYQELEIKQIKWPEGAAPQEALYTAYYECPHCHEHIDDRHKMDMIRHGEWRQINEKKDGYGLLASICPLYIRRGCSSGTSRRNSSP